MVQNIDPLDLIVDLIANRVVQKLRGPAGNDWINQSQSAGGRIRHCAEVRRVVAAGLPGGRIIGRSFELSPEAYSEFLTTLSKGKLPKIAKAEPSTVIDELRAELRVAGGRR